MQSIRSRIFYYLLKHYASRSNAGATLDQQRARFEESTRYLPMPPHVDVQKIAAGGLAAEWLLPLGSTKSRAILYLHGGAYTMGSCKTHRALASRVATAARTPALLPEFRLAPEHPFPAAVDDCVFAYCWLVEQGISPRQMVVAGDSSGGGLAVAVTVSLREKGVPLPAAIICLSPWADLTMTGDSVITRAHVDPVCSISESRYHAFHYIGDHDARSPLVSPIYADLRGLPPIFVQAGDREILLSDAVRLTERAQNDGGDAKLEVWDGMWHVWHMFAKYVPEGQRAIHRIGAFIRKHLN